jgi:hypothetical protein
VIRGENGLLLQLQNSNKKLDPGVPAVGYFLELTVSGRIARSAGQNETGEINVTVTNAKGATDALWLASRLAQRSSSPLVMAATSRNTRRPRSSMPSSN